MAGWTALCLVLSCVATAAQDSGGGPVSSPNSRMPGPGVAPMASTSTGDLAPEMRQGMPQGAPSPELLKMQGTTAGLVSTLTVMCNQVS